MRSNLLPIDQQLMCMSKSQPGDFHPVLASTSIKSEPYQPTSSESSRASCDDNDTIEFGPIKVKPRKKPAPTLATGRRSKYEILPADEEQKRNVRRARNRAAAERVRISRLNIEQRLLEQIEQLEQQESALMNDVEFLQHQKLHLETRIFTHEQMCSNVHLPTINEANLIPIENLPLLFQQTDKLAEIDFDSLFTDLNTEQMFRESQLPSDDLQDFLMDL